MCYFSTLLLKRAPDSYIISCMCSAVLYTVLKLLLPACGHAPEPSETLGTSIGSVNSCIFWDLIPGIGIGPVQCPEPRPILVSVLFNI